jgi:hypothetical protein
MRMRLAPPDAAATPAPADDDPDDDRAENARATCAAEPRARARVARPLRRRCPSEASSHTPHAILAARCGTATVASQKF